MAKINGRRLVRETTLTWRWFLTVFLAFVLGIAILHFSVREIRYRMPIDIDNYWPVSLVLPKLPVWIDAVTLVALGLLGWVYYRLIRTGRHSFGWVLVIGFLLMVGGNLLQGWQAGFIDPVLDWNNYWHDGLRISNLGEFIYYYNQLQPSFTLHGSSHPPGSIVVSYLVQQTVKEPYWWSLLMGIGGSATAALLYMHLRKRVGWRVARYAAGLFLILPAVNIYFIAGIDALVVTIFFATYWWWVNAVRGKLVGTALLLWLASSFNFAVIFLLPLLVFDDFRKNKTVITSVVVIAMTGLLWWGLRPLIGFDYFASFKFATSVEGVGGGYLFQNRLSYAVTRIEDVLEILLFLTPWLAVLLFSELKHVKPWLIKRWRWEQMAGFGALGSLMGFFIFGGYATGETARNCGYIYPFIMISVAYALVRWRLSEKSLARLFTGVCIQTISMQMLGYFYW